MALVSVSQPRSRQPKKDVWDKISVGLDIAQGVLGVGLAVPKFLQERRVGKLQEKKLEAETGALEAESKPISEAERKWFVSKGVQPDMAARLTKKEAGGLFKEVFESPEEKTAREQRELTMNFARSAEERARKADLRAGRKEDVETEERLKPKKLSEVSIRLLDEGRAIPNLIGKVDEILAKQPYLFDPIKGRVTGANPYAEESQVAQATIRSVSQAFGRYMEGGVLRKEDEEKYYKMFPQITDTKEVAAGKRDNVRNMLEQRQASLVGAFKSQGFDVTGFDGGQKQIAGDLDEDGTISEAEKWVMDNPDDPRLKSVIESIKSRKGLRGK